MLTYEQSLAAILAQLLEIEPDQLSTTKTFGEQGVDSLIGLRFARKIEELTSKQVDLEWLFEHPTIKQLAMFLEQEFGKPDAFQS